MQTVTLQEAQARLPELIAGLRNGDELMLTNGELAVAKIVGLPVEATAPKRKAGSARGMIIEREDCWKPDVEIWKDYM